MRLNLCLHRIGKRPDDPYCLPERKVLWILHILTLFGTEVIATFDDGYFDSCQFVKKYAPRFPAIQWYLFISPAQARNGSGFPWDKTPQRMASSKELLELAQIPYVFLGNHTNLHLKQSELSQSNFIEEYKQSFDLFESLLGQCTHLAFPYGTPEIDYTRKGADYLRQQYPQIQLWSTEARFQRSEKLPIRPRVVLRNEALPLILARIVFYRYIKRAV